MKFSLKLIYLLILWLDFHQASTGIPLEHLKKLTVLVTLTIFKVKVMYVGYLLN